MNPMHPMNGGTETKREQGTLMQTGLRRCDLDPDPFKQFDRWFQAARAARIQAPEAMALATATADGRPAVRMVLLRGFDERGFVFYTNYESRKGRELAENPRAAIVFYWAELNRQVRAEGVVTRVSREESERYFHSRPREHQLAAWASHQSETLASRAVLERRFDELAAMYADREIPLPPYWGGYRLSPDLFEFWQSRPGRLHDRFRYSRQPDGTWLIVRLAP